jgi:hypothetical protein
VDWKQVSQEAISGDHPNDGLFVLSKSISGGGTLYLGQGQFPIL